MASYIVVVFIHTPLWPGLSRGGGTPRPGYTFPNDSRAPTTKLDGISRLIFLFLFFFSSFFLLISFFFFRLLKIYERKWLSKPRDVANRMRGGERERELRGQWREVSVTFQWMGAWMRDCLWSPGWLSCSFFFKGGGRERRLRSTGVGRRGRATFLFYTRNSV